MTIKNGWETGWILRLKDYISNDLMNTFAELTSSSILQFLIFIALKDLSILCLLLLYKVTTNLKCGLSIKEKVYFKLCILRVPTFSVTFSPFLSNYFFDASS